MVCPGVLLRQAPWPLVLATVLATVLPAVLATEAAV